MADERVSHWSAILPWSTVLEYAIRRMSMTSRLSPTDT